MSTLKTDALLNLAGEARWSPLLKTAQATTSGTSFEYTGLPSWVTKITLMLKEVSLSGGDDFLVQLSTGGVYTVTGYLSTSLFIAAATANGSVSDTTGFVILANVAANSHSGHLVLTRFSAADHTWIASGVVRRSTTAVDACAGMVTLSGLMDGIRIKASGANTFDAGSINIMLE
jgi:hypothetical protein